MVFASLLISGGAIPASLYNAGRGVGLNVPVIFMHALLSSGSTVLAWHDLPQTGRSIRQWSSSTSTTDQLVIDESPPAKILNVSAFKDPEEWSDHASVHSADWSDAVWSENEDDCSGSSSFSRVFQNTRPAIGMTPCSLELNQILDDLYTMTTTQSAN